MNHLEQPPVEAAPGHFVNEGMIGEAERAFFAELIELNGFEAGE
jgi:hypothetical protein